VPVVFEAVAEAVAAEGHDLVGGGNSPKHAGLCQSWANNGFAAGFDDTRTDKESRPLKGGLPSPQQLAQRGGPGTRHRGASGHFHGFSMQTACLAQAAQDHLQQLFYFLDDFLLDRRRRFFPAGKDLALPPDAGRRSFR
jgi:hypothetical protein